MGAVYRISATISRTSSRHVLPDVRTVVAKQDHAREERAHRQVGEPRLQISRRIVGRRRTPDRDEERPRDDHEGAGGAGKERTSR